MENMKIEALESNEIDCTHDKCFQELTEVQLSFIGGGVGEVIIG